MKPKKLMIEDWVDFGSFKRQVTQMDFCQDVNGDCILDGTEPILLTSEILETNRFIKQWNCNWMLEDNHRFILSKDMYINIGGLSLKVEFVHELQHALRLCGSKKEIII